MRSAPEPRAKPGSVSSAPRHRDTIAVARCGPIVGSATRRLVRTDELHFSRRGSARCIRHSFRANRAQLVQAKRRSSARWLFVLAPIVGIVAVVAAIMIRNARQGDEPEVAIAPKTAPVHVAGVQETDSAAKPTFPPPTDNKTEMAESGTGISAVAPAPQPTSMIAPPDRTNARCSRNIAFPTPRK